MSPIWSLVLDEAMEGASFILPHTPVLRPARSGSLISVIDTRVSRLYKRCSSVNGDPDSRTA